MLSVGVRTRTEIGRSTDSTLDPMSFRSFRVRYAGRKVFEIRWSKAGFFLHNRHLRAG
jgi:hypothetical protein